MNTSDRGPVPAATCGLPAEPNRLPTDPDPKSSVPNPLCAPRRPTSGSGRGLLCAWDRGFQQAACAPRRALHHPGSLILPGSPRNKDADNATHRSWPSSAWVESCWRDAGDSRSVLTEDATAGEIKLKASTQTKQRCEWLSRREARVRSEE